MDRKVMKTVSACFMTAPDGGLIEVDENENHSNDITLPTHLRGGNHSELWFVKTSTDVWSDKNMMNCNFQVNNEVSYVKMKLIY